MQIFAKRFAVLTGFAIMLIMLAANAAILRHELAAQLANEVLVTHTRQLMLELAQTESLFKDAELGQRGFLYTNAPEYLAPYELATTQIGQHLDNLQLLTADDPRQQARIAVLRQLAQKKMDELAQTISLAQSGRTEEAKTIVVSAAGLFRMIDIRRLIDEMSKEEDALDTVRSAHYQKSVRTTFLYIYLVNAISALGLILLAYHILREMGLRKRAEGGLRESEERLRLFVEHAPAALAMFDHEMRYVRVSRRWPSDYGLDDSDLMGRSHYDVFPDIPDHRKEAHRRGLVGEVLQGEERYNRFDGSAWVRWEVRPWHDSTGGIGGIVIFSEDITVRKRAEESLRLQAEQLRALTASLQRVREAERTTVARDLHDQIGQVLTAIKMEITWIARRLPQAQGEVHDRIKGMVELINDGIQSVRNICTGLRPGVLDDLGLAAAIEWQANEFAGRTGISCQVSLPPVDLQLDGEQSTAIFRIFQESLTNVIRHADARSVRASLYQQDGNLTLVVEDDGKGFRQADLSGSLGFLGMQERAQECGGEVQISSSPGNGTTVIVRLPVHTKPEREDYAHLDSR